MVFSARFRQPAALGWLLPVFALACGSELEPKRPSNVKAALAPELATVMQVTWHTDEPTIGYVEYGPTAAMEWSSPMEDTPATEHSVTLLGLHADTAYSFRVVTWDGDDAGASEIASFRSGALPSGLPAFTATGGDFDDFVAVPLRGDPAAVVVLDPSGAIVWYHLDESGLDVLRARISDDGRSVLYNRTDVSADSTEDSAIVRVALDGSGETPLPVPFLAHDFLELDDGAFAALVVDERDGVRGDAIVEVTPGGDLTTVWSTWDAFDPADEPGDGENGAWTYANSLAQSGSDGAYYVGLQNFSSVLKIPAGGGDPEWVLGSTAATLDFADGATPFTRQSGIVRFGASDLFVLDNDGEASRLVQYSLDVDGEQQAIELRSYVATPSVQVGDIGGLVRLDSGAVVISWGDAGRIEAVDKAFAPLWGLRADGEARLGYHDVAGSLYPTGSQVRTPAAPETDEESP
ncbi:MAG TPA: fibronectin type III domain-containing protein [Polyangiaceae bacterium]